VPILPRLLLYLVPMPRAPSTTAVPQTSSQGALYSLRQRATWWISLLGLMWLVELANMLEGHVFHTWGILPRTQVGLRGVLFGPFLHASPEHLALNTLPLAVMAWLVLTHGPWAFVRVTATVMLISGLGVWGLARDYYHIGASGLVLGYFGFLIANAFLERSWNSILLAALALLLYGGLIVTVLPGANEVSWESHLAGLLAGVVAAMIGGGRKRAGRVAA